MHSKFIASFLLPLAMTVSAAPAEQAAKQNVAFGAFPPPFITGMAQATATATVYKDVTTTVTSKRVETKVNTEGSAATVSCIDKAISAANPMVTVTTTATNMITTVKIESSTTTVTVPAPTAVVANGLTFHRYSHSFSEFELPTKFHSDFFRTCGAPLACGRVNDLNFNVAIGQDLQLPGAKPFSTLNTGLVFTGGFKALETGTYTFETSDKIDNWGYFWIGDAAAKDFTDDNASFRAGRIGDGQAMKMNAGVASIKLNKGDVVPFTFLWANGSAEGVSVFVITTPSGKRITDATGHFVETCTKPQ